MIVGHGPSEPIALLIADGGQGEDIATNRALSGFQESLLSQFCRDNELNLAQFWRTALIKEEVTRPRDDTDATYTAANANRVAQYSPILVSEIAALGSNLLIPLGELSFNFLTGLSGIRKFRGSVLPSSSLDREYKVLPILGPYPYLYSDFKQKYITRIDFSKIKRNLGLAALPDSKANVWVARSSGALRAFIDRSYTQSQYLVFDIETFKGIPSCISFCFDGKEAVCVPLIDRSIDVGIRVLFFDLVAKLLASPLPKVNQNIKFDWKIMERWGFKVNNVVGDTMIAASCLYCEFPKNLGFLTSIYTDLPYFKDEGKEFDPERHKKDQLYLYNAKDSLATHQVYSKQIVELEEQGVDAVYKKTIKILPLYKEMEANGIRIDQEQRDRLLAKYSSIYHIHNLMLNNLVGRNINPLSSLAMNELIFKELKYKPLRKAWNTSEDSLMLLRILSEAAAAPSTGPKIIDLIIACRKLHKVIEILELPQYPDNRFRCEFNLGGAETGRTTAGKSLDELLVFTDKGKIRTEYLGHSLQTIGKHGFSIDGVTYGKDIRSIFVPSRGYRFVECDLSQAEARVDAVLAGNFDILKVFDGPVGIHRLTGSWAYGCDPSEIKKNVLVDGVDRYHVAKQVRHSGERNITAEGLVTKFLWGVSLSEGNRLLTAFHQYQPEIRGVFHRDVIRSIDSAHALISPNGRRRDFFDRITRSTYNEGYSFLPQAIVSDQTKFSLLQTSIDCPKARFLVEAHDGVLAELPIGDEADYIRSYKRNVERPIDFRQGSLPRDYSLVIPCESSVGDNWNDMREVTL